MNAEQIMTALRLVAMGRPGHPDVQALADYLAREPEAYGVPLPQIHPEMLETAECGSAIDTNKPKRGRKAKAE